VLGPALGALALAVLALHQVMLVDVVTACTAILPLLFVRIPEPERTTGFSAGPVWNDVLAGFRYIRSLPGVLALMALAVVLNFVGAPTWTLLPLYVRDVFGGSAGDLGLIQSGFGLGLIIGGLALSLWGGRLRGNRALIALGGVAISQLGVFGVASAPANMLWLVSASWTLFAVFNAVANGTLMAVLQGAVAPDMQGRVQSAVSSGVMMAMPLGLAVSTPAVELLGLRFWYFLSATVALVGALWAMTSRRVLLLDTIGSADAPRPAPELAAEIEG
jgi:MFS transporter, DHA3 family, macrolide efflux protein